MRWLGFAALVFVASGCTVHVVERPVSPVMVAEPAHSFPAPAEARRRARPAPPLPPPPVAHPARVEPPREALTSKDDVRLGRLAHLKAPKQAQGQPAEAKPGKSKPDKSKPTRPVRPAKRERLSRFDIEPSDVPPITDHPQDERPSPAPRSASFPKPKQHALDLRQ